MLDALLAEARLRWGLDPAEGIAVVPAERLVAVPVSAGVDPLLDALRTGGRATATALMEPPAGADPILASGLDAGTAATGAAAESDSEAAAMAPDYYLVLPWHFKDGIIRREQEFLASGGKLIFPFPEIEIVGG